jgi:hypothetical protein
MKDWLRFSCHVPLATCSIFDFTVFIFVTPSLEFVSRRLLNPNIGAHHAHDLKKSPTKCHLKRDLWESLWPKAHPKSWRPCTHYHRSQQPNHVIIPPDPPTYIRKDPWCIHQCRKARGLNGTAIGSWGGDHHRRRYSKPKPTPIDQNHRRHPAIIWGRNWSSCWRRAGTPPPRKWALSPGAGANDQAKSSHEESPNNATANWTRESSTSRAAMSYRRSPSRTVQALSARTFAAAAITTTANCATTASEAAPSSNAGHHRE